MHWQILTRQVDRLEEFYTALFGWKFSADNQLGYRMIDTGSPAGVRGGMWPSGPDGHGLVQLFVKVDDVKTHVAKAESLGARVVVPPQVLPGGDEVAIAVDPDGIAFAMFRGAGDVPL